MSNQTTDRTQHGYLLKKATLIRARGEVLDQGPVQYQNVSTGFAYIPADQTQRVEEIDWLTASTAGGVLELWHTLEPEPKFLSMQEYRDGGSLSAIYNLSDQELSRGIGQTLRLPGWRAGAAINSKTLIQEISKSLRVSVRDLPGPHFWVWQAIELAAEGIWVSKRSHPGIAVRCQEHGWEIATRTDHGWEIASVQTPSFDLSITGLYERWRVPEIDEITEAESRALSASPG